MQIESVDTKAGVAICDALSRTISSMSFSGSASRLRFMFSTSTVASVHQNADGQSESAERHNIDRFSDRAKHNNGG